MASIGVDKAFDRVAQLLKSQETKKKEDAQLKEMKKIIADVRKISAANLATIKKETEEFEMTDGTAARHALAEQLRKLDDDLEKHNSDIQELDEEREEAEKEYAVLENRCNEVDQQILERKNYLEQLTKKSEAELRKADLEIELMEKMTGLRFPDDGSSNIFAVVGNNNVTGHPDLMIVRQGENSTGDEIDIVNNTWAAIEKTIAK